MNGNENFECLLPKTRLLLEELIGTAPFLKDFVFVGGSALALHLCHRKSEDLDFFTYEAGRFDKAVIRKYLARFHEKSVLNESDDQLDLLVNGVKVTFFDAAWDFLRPTEAGGLHLASLQSIAAMKVNVLFLRAKYRDYYDLYCLAKKMSLKEIFRVSENVVEGLTFKLLCVALVYIDDIEDDNIDHLEPEETLTKEEIQKFFEARMR